MWVNYLIDFDVPPRDAQQEGRLHHELVTADKSCKYPRKINRGAYPPGYLHYLCVKFGTICVIMVYSCVRVHNVNTV